MSNISQRDAFFDRLYELARADRNVVIVAADMAAPSLDKFRVDLPTQFVNVGIAEQNAILISSGLALTGKKVFAYAIAPFITLRCIEEIRINNAIMNIPITIVGMGASFTYENDGPTHHIVEDIAAMRSMPNISINSITDSVMAAAFADISYKKTTGTNYVRIDKYSPSPVYKKDFDFSKGLCTLKEGRDFVLFSTGSISHLALEVAESLKKKGIALRVVDVFNIPVNERNLLAAIKGVKKIITLEEHFLPGGFGSAVSEVLIDNGISLPVKRLGLDPELGYCYKYGGRDIIRGYYGIDKRGLEKSIIKFIRG
jgi:transketolase